MALPLQILKAAIHAYPTAERVTWSLGQIRRALISYHQGIWLDVALLYESMFNDDHFPGELEKRVDATLKSEFYFQVKGLKKDEPLSPRDEEAQDLFLQIMAPTDELAEFLSTFDMLGVGIGTLDWDTETMPGRWLPRFRSLPIAYLQYDQYRCVWTYQAQDGLHVVTPGDGKWILMTSGETGWKHGLINGLSYLWHTKIQTLCDWARYNIKHGLPITKAKVPVLADAGEKEKFIDDLEDLESEGIIGLPQDESGKGYDVELMEAKDTSWQSFENNVNRADRKISIALLGSNLGSETNSTGSNRAAAETSDLGVARNKAASDAKQLGECLREQLLTPFYALNFGPASLPAPFPLWDVSPVEDDKAWAETQDKFAEMLGKLKRAGYRVRNLDEASKPYGLQLIEFADTVSTQKPEDTAPAPGAPPPPEDDAPEEDEAKTEADKEEAAA
jgi:phage gp29-like protein